MPRLRADTQGRAGYGGLHELKAQPLLRSSTATTKPCPKAPPTPATRRATRASLGASTPPLTAAQLAKCETGMARSADESKTWSKPELLKVNNSLGPHYGGSGLNHGIQIRKGPHSGRLAMARRMNCKAAMGDHNEQQYFHSFVIFSDDNGTRSSFCSLGHSLHLRSYVMPRRCNLDSRTAAAQRLDRVSSCRDEQWKPAHDEPDVR